MDKYDLVVIGAGPAGFAAAMRSLDFKKKTLLVEKNLIGGAGVTNGALSSKTWWELSREAAAFNTSLKRHNMQAPEVRYSEIQGEVMRAIQMRKDLLEEQMAHLINASEHLLEFKKGRMACVAGDRHHNRDGRSDHLRPDEIILSPFASIERA